MTRRSPGPRSARKNLDPVDLLMQLLAIPGPSGQEARVVDFVREELLSAGARPAWIRQDAAHRRTPAGGEVGNLVLRLPGRRGVPRRMLMAHLDTVPLCVSAKPVRKGNIIRSADPRTGLGADDRAGVAVLLHTARSLLRDPGWGPPLTFLWTVQEEIGLQGARAVRLGLLGKPRFAFNWDGGDAAKLTIGATGGYRMTIDITGRASHAGNAPERGISAIAVAALAIADLHRGGWHGKVTQPEGTGTSNVGIIRGGAATNVVADRTRVAVEARSHQPKFRRRIVRQIEQAFRNAASEICDADGKPAKVAIAGRLDYEAFCLPPDHPCVAAAAAAVRQVGRSPELAVTNGGLDANWISAQGIPTVSLGCGQRHQHTTAEALDLRQFEDACQIAGVLARGAEEAAA